MIEAAVPDCLMLPLRIQGAEGGGWQSGLNADRISVGGHECVIGD